MQHLVLRSSVGMFPAAPATTATAGAEMLPFCPPWRGGTFTDWVVFTSMPELDVNITPAGTEIIELLLLTKSTLPLACAPAIVVVPVVEAEPLPVITSYTLRSGMIRVLTSAFLTCGEAVNRKVSCS